MRQVIPFKKDIIFKTKLEEITSISLEHSLKLDNDNFISGEFIISGDYKVSSTSNRLELFSYNIPFDIALDNSYIVEESTIDIEDFYYEIINDDTLRVNIEISIEGDIKPEETVEDILLESMEKEAEHIETEEPIDQVYSFSTKDDNDDKNKNEDREDITITKEDTIIEESQEEVAIQSDENVKSLFSAINSEEEETFTTYHVHIVRENEDMETILKKYNVTKEEFLNYNSADEIVLGNKLIIPATIKNE